MSTELHQPTRSLDEAPQAAATLTRIVRFLHVVRVRKGLLFTSLFVAVLLAGLYYATAPRLYESNARLYVLQMGSNVLDEAIESQGGVRENMANYQGVLTSDGVHLNATGNLFLATEAARALREAVLAREEG